MSPGVQRGRLFRLEMRAIFGGVRPDHGGRLELKLATATDARAHYRLVISTPLAETGADAQVDALTSSVEIGVWDSGAPPAWLEALARTLLRTMLRNKASDGEWPRRVTRWRPEPAPRGPDPVD